MYNQTYNRIWGEIYADEKISKHLYPSKGFNEKKLQTGIWN